MKWVLLIWFWAGSSSGMTTVDGFTSEAECEAQWLVVEAKLKKRVRGPGSLREHVCLGVS